MNLIDTLKNYKAEVQDAEWERIAHSPEVIRFNRSRRILRAAICTASVAIVMTVAVVVGLKMAHPKETAKVSTEHSMPAQTTASTPSLQHVDGETTQQTMTPAAVEPVITTIEIVDEQNGTPATELATSASSTPTGPGLQRATIPASVTAPATSHSTPPVASMPKMVKQETPVAAPKTMPKENIVAEETPEQPMEPAFEEQFFVPNSFTPNGDGLNDLFQVVSNYEPKYFEIAIYARSGEMVFNTRNIHIGWDGDKHPAGLYNYVVKYTNLQGKTQTKKGQVMMLK